MVVVALNAVIISIAFYALAQILGLPAFMSFYWQDFLPLAASPAIISIILGIAGAMLVKRRKRSDLFHFWDRSYPRKPRQLTIIAISTPCPCRVWPGRSRRVFLRSSPRRFSIRGG